MHSVICGGVCAYYENTFQYGGRKNCFRGAVSSPLASTTTTAATTTTATTTNDCYKLQLLLLRRLRPKPTPPVYLWFRVRGPGFSAPKQPPTHYCADFYFTDHDLHCNIHRSACAKLRRPHRRHSSCTDAAVVGRLVANTNLVCVIARGCADTNTVLTEVQWNQTYSRLTNFSWWHNTLTTQTYCSFDATTEVYLIVSC